MEFDPKSWLIDFFKSIPVEDIERFIDEDSDLVLLISQKAREVFESSPAWVKDFVIGLLRMHWKELDEFLSDPDKIIAELIRIRPELIKVFAKKHRREWLVKTVANLRDYLYRLAWETL